MKDTAQINIRLPYELKQRLMNFVSKRKRCSDKARSFSLEMFMAMLIRQTLDALEADNTTDKKSTINDVGYMLPFLMIKQKFISYMDGQDSDFDDLMNSFIEDIYTELNTTRSYHA